MTTYKDANENAWEITINIGTLRRIKNTVTYNGAQFDLLNLTNPGTLEALATDTLLLMDILAVLTETQRKEKGIPVDEFEKAHCREALLYAREAVMMELAEFFPTLERMAIYNVITSMQDARNKAVEALKQQTGTAYGN